MKVCARCKKEKEIKEFAVDTTASDGRYGRCKTCINDIYWLKNKDNPKICSRCNTEKSRSEFYKCSGQSSPYCKLCTNCYHAEKRSKVIRRCAVCKLEKPRTDFPDTESKQQRSRVCISCKPAFGYKRCARCKENKPLTEFHGKGTHAYCKACGTSYSVARRKSRVRPLSGLKICSMCNIPRDVREYYNHNSTTDGLDKSCKECIRSRANATSGAYFSCAPRDKRCGKCHTTKPSSQFIIQRNRRDHLGTWCRECFSKHQEQPTIIKLRRLTTVKRTFGLQPEEYERLDRVQGGLCAICNLPETKTLSNPRKLGAIPRDTPQHLCVDHCHKNR